MKKIVIIAIALLVFFMPIQQMYLETNAALWSKAASKTAVKAAKEIVADMAINKTINVIADTSKHVKDSNRMVKEGHMLFCMDYTYKPGDKCSKPASVKQNITDTDKANIKKQSQTEIEKLISPNGKGFTKWQKFLDWFVPVWLISFAATALTYAMSPDVQNLFDEAAYNSLLALGLIDTVIDSEINPIRNMPDMALDIPNPPVGEPLAEAYSSNFSTTLVSGNGLEQNTSIPEIPKENLYFVSEINANGSLVTYYNLSESQYGDGVIHGFTYNWQTGNNSYVIGDSANSYTLLNPVVTTLVNGEPHGEYDMSRESRGPITIGIDRLGSISILKEQIKSIQSRSPYKIGEFWYTDVLFNTVNGNSIEFQTKSTRIASWAMNNIKQTVSLQQNNSGMTINSTVYRNEIPNKIIFPPPFEEVETDLNMSEHSSYKDKNGHTAVLPPTAFIYEEETTGEQVERKENANGDGYTWQKPDGTEVPEESVIPKEEQEPKITPSPDGTPEYTPAPTPSNPNPEPAPLTPSPDGQTEPPQPEEPPLSEFPEGEKCGATLKMPVFSPLKEQLSTSFPFSIPWDIERAAKAAFGGVGNEKPSFDMVIPVGDDKHEFKITTPAFLDDWKPFMDTFLLLSFDILLMFGLYRFVKGAGS